MELQSAISSISPQNIQSATRIFQKISNGNIQSVNNIDPELARIIILPLLDNIDIQESANKISSFGEIEYAEPNYIYHIDGVPTPNDSLYDQQWALRVMNVPEAWQVTEGDSSIHIGFVDTGVEWDHPELIGQFAVNPAEDINHNGLFDPWPSTEKRMDAHGNMVFGDLDGIDEDGNGYVDDVIGYDFVDQSSLNFGDTKGRDPIPQDEEPHTHGTAVAGVIAAKANNKIGVAGIAPKCKLVALRAFDATGNAEDDDIASAIVYAADNNVRILNLSFGDIVPSLLQRDAIRYATSKGVLVFASSGNDGSTNPHYPSDFDECVSVGGTVLATDNVSESEWAQSTHGVGMDLIAPAVQIYTLFGANDYQAISGTSFSSPEAAAVAGLVWSNNPNLSAIEVRSIIESTCNHLSIPGFGPFEANGRIDAFAAVSYKGSAAIKITSPHTNDGFHVGDKITIMGSAVSTLFTDYTLSFTEGANPDASIIKSATNFGVISTANAQVIDDSLGVWDTHGLDTTTYTLTLTVNSSDHHSTEERIVIYFLPQLPKIDTLYSIPIFVNEKRGLLVQAHTDTLTTATLYVRARGSQHWLTKKDDRFTKGHNILLSSSEVPVLTPLEMKLVAINSARDSVSQTLFGTISSEAVNQRGFVQKNYSLPLGYALDTVLATSTGDQVVMSTFPDGTDFGPLKIFSFDRKAQQFIAVDSLSVPWIPRSIGNTTGDNKPELLLQAGNSYKIYKQNADHSLLGTIINADTTTLNKLAIGLVDVDNDGKQEIVFEDTELVAANHIRSILKVFKVVGSTTTFLGKLIDPTPPGPFQTDNNYNEPDAQFADINKDAKLDILAVDDDADIVAYEYDPSSINSFSPIFQDINDGSTEGRLLSTGDFNGDGKPDIALAFHTPYDPNADNEYDASYWTVKVMLGNGDATFKTIYTDHFYLARSLAPYRASVGSIHNVTGKTGDDLVLSLFPNFYLLEYDSTLQSMKPIWHFPVSNSPRGALAFDFDGNGKREFGFNSGDSLHFFEREDNFADQTTAPSGLDAMPRDTNRVDLTWGSVSGAVKYYILRTDTGQGNNLFVKDSTINLFFSDTTVTNDSDFIYSVEAFDASKKISTSEPTFGVLAHVHSKPFINGVSSTDERVHIHTSQPVSTQGIDGGVFTIDDSLVSATAIIANDSEIIVTSPSNLQGTVDHKIKVNSFALRDVWNSPFDTSLTISWKPQVVVSIKDFYIIRWSFEGNLRIHLEFNLRPDDDALNISHYSLSPFGTFTHVSRDTTNPNALYLDLAPGTIISALGIPFILCVKNITAEFNIPLKETEGNCVGETLTEPNLLNVMVYPNPARSSDEELTFARLTAVAEISIYSLDHRFLKRLQTSDKNGGVQWDMRDETGRILPSGVYWYHVTVKDDNGNDVEPIEAKFVMIRNK